MAAGEKIISTTKVIKTTTQSLTTLYDPCKSKANKCSNNSLCVFDNTLAEKYYCECEPGWEGEYCQKDERPCQPHRNKCINNSTCNQSGRQYNCTCSSGFDGINEP